MIVIFQKKPVQVEAIQWTGENKDEVEAFLDGNGYAQARYVLISTLEGVMNADTGDWIIKGVKGEFYPCKPDIMGLTYERIGPKSLPKVG